MAANRSGNLRLDPVKLEQARVRAGLSQQKLFRTADITEKTGYKAARGDRIRFDTALCLAQAVGIDDLNDLLPDDGTVTLEKGAGLPTEWEPTKSLTPWITSANGLQYRVYQLTHRKLSGELARAKQFDLDNVACERAGELRDVLLTRHAQVCRKLHASGYFPVNQSVSESADGRHLWVIDSWPSGEPVFQLATAGETSDQLRRRIGYHVACAIHQLHAHQIVLRDLHPETVFYHPKEDRLTIVDCELAKLLDGSPTVVAGELVKSPYHAPECVGHKIDETADIFSWAQLLVFLASGREPPVPAEPALLGTLSLPPKLLATIKTCLEDGFRSRPTSFGELLPKLERWAES